MAGFLDEYRKTLKAAEDRTDRTIIAALKYIVANKKSLYANPLPEIGVADGFIKLQKNTEKLTETIELGMQSASYLIHIKSLPWVTGIYVHEVEVWYKTGEYPESKTAEYAPLVSYARYKEDGKPEYQWMRKQIGATGFYTEAKKYGGFLLLVDALKIACGDEVS